VRGRCCYFYRAIDSCSSTIDFLLSAARDADAAKRLFRKALSNPGHPQPRVINTDQAAFYGAAIPDLKQEGTLRQRSRHRPVLYLTTSWNKTTARLNVGSTPSRGFASPGGISHASGL
jgi:IS6 family transposase